MIAQLFRLTGRGLRDMFLHPWAQLLTLVAVSMVTVLAGVFLMVLHNVDQELIRTRGQVEFQVFWNVSVDAAQVEQQWEELRTLEGIKEITTYTPALALADLAATLGEAGDFSWLEGHNPLPPSATLAFAIPDNMQGQGWAEDMLNHLKSMPGVESVHYNPMQMDLARGWVRLSQTIVWPVIGFLGLVVALVVGNTVKLSLYNRRDEIEILHLVGAKPWFIRWPLLTSGFVLGLLGGGAALGMLKLLQHSLRDLLDFPPLFLKIRFLPPEQAAALVGVVVFVTVCASWVAVSSKAE